MSSFRVKNISTSVSALTDTGLVPIFNANKINSTNVGDLTGILNDSVLKYDSLKKEWYWTITGSPGPRKADYAGLRTTTATIYTDEYMVFQWDGANVQLKFSPQAITGGLNWDAGLRISKSGQGNQNTSLNVFSFIPTVVGTFKYFSGALDTQYNCGSWGNFIEYFIMSENGSISIPSYRIKVINGYNPMHILIDKTIP